MKKILKQTLIIGAGPAGLSAAFYLARSGKTQVTVISNGQSALQRADKIENYFGFAEPVSGRQLLEDSRKNAERLGATFIDTEITDLQINMEMKFEAYSSDGEKRIYDCVLIATGASRKTPPISGLKDFEGRGVSYCAVCDAFFYRGKDTAVIGSGSYALHEAMTLANTSSSVTVLTNGHEPSFEATGKIRVDKRKISAISGNDRVDSVVFEDGEKLYVSGVFVAIGTAGSTDLARKVGAPISGSNIIVDEKMSTVVPGLYAAGDCTGGLLQISKAVSDGAAAAVNMIKFLG